MAARVETLSEALTGEKRKSSKSNKAKKKSCETSEAGSSDIERNRQNSTESNNCINDQQNTVDFQINSSNNETDASLSISVIEHLDTYQVFDSKKSRKKIRYKAIDMMRQIGYTVMVVKPGRFATKYASSAPYHLFFTRIENSKETYNQQFSITFPEILDRSLGEIVNSLHLNFMVNVTWLYLQYLLAGQRINMTILYGTRLDDAKLSNNITMIEVDMPNKFGCHHTKIMILQYKDDGIRVVVSTANLYSNDWENRTQGLWISPHLPRLPESAHPNDGESLTGFKKALERYLSKYELPILTQWIHAVRRADFSDVNVFLVASVPGFHKGADVNFWGCKRLAYILTRYVTLPPDAPQWPIVAQSSAVGSFGSTIENWLLKHIIQCMSKGFSMGLKNDPHQWKAKRTGRDRAMPHIKCYTRISPDSKNIPWFLLTSANLSKSAWGTIYQHSYSIGNYEAGVIFIPKCITGTTTFPIGDEEDSAVPVFPIPYDLPLCPYESSDHPFVGEFLI
ncbi:putative tyrosyl-DNA phosphodiesterase [Cyphomyrmex costatus]|uniref:Putative tyrosyl-DNA phosphodiesterase n=1 Tax=Cyphomyrmex costatus TaxID=456900 RepID=A0A195CB86_9HYME|nr:putative tyrosyl-DNA phosphodiesterase [Cyphomyrmex costatus]